MTARCKIRYSLTQSSSILTVASRFASKQPPSPHLMGCLDIAVLRVALSPMQGAKIKISMYLRRESEVEPLIYRQIKLRGLLAFCPGPQKARRLNKKAMENRGVIPKNEGAPAGSNCTQGCGVELVRSLPV